MTEFRLRIWQEQVLFDCNDYVVDADSLEAAVRQLQEVQDKAQDSCRHQTAPNNIEHADYYESVVRVLDPEEIVSGSSGITLIDGKGERLRDLVGVPTGCEQLGKPLLPPEGALFRSKNDELDQDHNDEERITPAGSIWEVREVRQSKGEPSGWMISIVCEETGGWINPGLDDLNRGFEPV